MSAMHGLVVYGCVSGAIWGAWSIHLTLVGLELNVTGRVCGGALLWWCLASAYVSGMEFDRLSNADCPALTCFFVNMFVHFFALKCFVENWCDCSPFSLQPKNRVVTTSKFKRCLKVNLLKTMVYWPTLPFKSLWCVRFFEKSILWEGCIYLIKSAVKSVYFFKYYNLK